MRFILQVERLRPLVEELGAGIPADLILGIVYHESRGIPGHVSRARTRSEYTDAERSCGLPPELSARALGLMQITPINLRHYNLKHANKITPCQLAGKDDDSIRAQLRAGITYFRSCLRWAHNVDPVSNPWPHGRPSKTQVELAALAYAQGIGGATAQIKAAAALGLAKTKESIQRINPDWGAPEKPFKFAVTIAKLIEPAGPDQNTKKK